MPKLPYDVRRAATLMTEPSSMSKITVVIGALSGSKAAGCLDSRMSYTSPEPGTMSSKQRTPPFPAGEEDKSWRAAAVLPKSINFTKDCDKQSLGTQVCKGNFEYFCPLITE